MGTRRSSRLSRRSTSRSRRRKRRGGMIAGITNTEITPDSEATPENVGDLLYQGVRTLMRDVEPYEKLNPRMHGRMAQQGYDYYLARARFVSELLAHCRRLLDADDTYNPYDFDVYMSTVLAEYGGEFPFKIVGTKMAKLVPILEAYLTIYSEEDFNLGLKG